MGIFKSQMHRRQNVTKNDNIFYEFLFRKTKLCTFTTLLKCYLRSYEKLFFKFLLEVEFEMLMFIDFLDGRCGAGSIS